MSVTQFTAKERLRFRKLLEVAHSTTYEGEREAALHAAARLAAAHGLSLREAAGMAEHRTEARETPREHRAKAHGRPAGFPADFGAASGEQMGRWWSQRRGSENAEKTAAGVQTEVERYAAEKRRHAAAMEDAIRRGLDEDIRKAEEIKRRRAETLRARSGLKRANAAWRPRPEFIRVLLTETSMSAKDIAAVAGVTIYDVFREKLLMRPAKDAAAP
ncbi:MAG: DUF2786 domain-containing protein [Rhodospirillaceae bacterium]